MDIIRYMHKNLFEFKASSNYELGLMLGDKFSFEANGAINDISNDSEWGKKVDIAKIMYEISKRYFPQYICELEGYATGSKVEFWDFFTLALEDDVDLKQLQAKCTTIITNNGLLMGHSEDTFEPNWEDTVCLVKKQVGKLRTFEIFYYNTLGGASVGLNSNGYCHSGNTLFYTPLKIGVPKCFSSRFLFDSNDPLRDISYLSTIDLASGYSQNILSPYGQFINAEITSSSIKTISPQFPFVHTNHCLTDQSIRKDDYGTNTRRKIAAERIQKSSSVDELKSILEDSSQGNDKSIYNERTIGRGIFDLKNKCMHAWLKREENLGWVEYPFDFLVG